MSITRSIPAFVIPGLQTVEPQEKTGYRAEREQFAKLAAGGRPARRWRWFG